MGALNDAHFGRKYPFIPNNKTCCVATERSPRGKGFVYRPNAPALGL